jgi:hypothetical protein
LDNINGVQGDGKLDVTGCTFIEAWVTKKITPTKEVIEK